MLIAALHDSGVDTGYAARSDRPTTLAFVRLVDGQATYAFYDENTASRMLDIADLPDLDDRVSALFFGGISLVVEPCGSAFEALAMREAPRRAVMLDPNIRPGFIRDEAAYRARIGRMIALADIVKLSDDDLHWLEGPGPVADLAAVLLDRGPKLVCITEGAQGATGFSRAGTVSVPAQKVQVVDTVGAGDTFNAGLLAGLDGAGTLTKEGLAALPLESLRAALDLGVRAAAVTVARAGANPPRRDEL
jgi:fructokinase